MENNQLCDKEMIISLVEKMREKLIRTRRDLYPELPRDWNYLSKKFFFVGLTNSD